MTLLQGFTRLAGFVWDTTKERVLDGEGNIGTFTGRIGFVGYVIV